MRALDRDRESLWRLLIAPALWAGHFLASYAAVAVWCAKVAGRDGGLGALRPALLIFTMVVLACIARVAGVAWRAHRFGGGAVPHDADTAEDRHRLLGLATFLLAALSAVAVVFTALAVALIGSCA